MTALVEHHQQEPLYDDSILTQASKMQQPETAKNVVVYRNGDRYYPGKRFVVNRRHISDFNGFLNLVTNGLKPAFGAVRNIYTPNCGHKVTELGEINNGMTIVAGGVEKFRKLHYQEILAPSRRPGRPRNDYATIRPVHHNTRMNVAARWKDFSKGPCNIFVYWNGDINGSAIKLLLIPRILKVFELVLEEITEKLGTRTGHAVRSLYTLNGELIVDGQQLDNGGYYVAVGNAKFKKLPYGERAQHMAMMQSVRRPQVQLPPIRRRVRTMNSTKPGDNSYSQKYAARRQMEDRAHQSQPPPGTVRPPPNRRLKPVRGPAPPPSSESDSVFHAKPVKVKRSGASGKITQVSENEDDVFRAKREPIKAEEVADDEDTKVDLPIDQVPAETVEDEEDLDVTVQHDEGGKRDRSPSPTSPKTTYATRLEEDESEPTEPSKTPTSARREAPQPSARSVEKNEPNGSVVEPSEEPEQREEEPQQDNRDQEKAAVVIQSSYKGYRVRREMKRQKVLEQKSTEHDEPQPEDVPTLQKEEDEQPQPEPQSEERSKIIAEDDQDTTRADEEENPKTPHLQEEATRQESSKPASPDHFPKLVEEDGPHGGSVEIEGEPLKPATPEANGDGEPATQESNDVYDPPLNDAPEAHTESTDVLTEDTPEVRSSPGENKPDEPAVDVSSDQARPSSRPDTGASVHDEITKEEKPDLPERDAGDGVEETEKDQRPDEAALQNGAIPTEENETNDVKASKESSTRPDSVTQEGGEEVTAQPEKVPPETGPIPNGQPATMLES